MLVANMMIDCIRLYQKIAPSFMRDFCRYTPSCSQYAIIAIKQRGAIRGSMLALCRILRCIPPLGGDDWPQITKQNRSVSNTLS